MEDQAERLKGVDRQRLGRRLRAARVAAGLTQGQVASGLASVAYLSRIESGQRRPDADLLRRLAERLAVDPDTLLTDVPEPDPDELRLALDWAELALESGETAEAERRTGELLAAPLPPHLVPRAQLLRGRALEALGRLDEAVLALEALADDPDDPTWLPSRIALSRCHREAGDLTAAVECGEAALRRLVTSGLAGSDEALQLRLTVVAAYFERGDVATATRVCAGAVADAERSGSPTARASAYWNASVLEAERGRTGTAVALAGKALALLGEGNDRRNLARLRLELGLLQLAAAQDADGDPDADAGAGLDEAERTLRRAGRELAGSSASRVDVARGELALARVALHRGDASTAEAEADRVRDSVGEDAPLLAAHARMLQGRACFALGDGDRARAAYRDAVRLLTGMGADRAAAEAWFELGALWEGAGELDSARQAYRSAAAATGLRVPMAVTEPVGLAGASAAPAAVALHRPGLLAGVGDRGGRPEGQRDDGGEGRDEATSRAGRAGGRAGHGGLLN